MEPGSSVGGRRLIWIAFWLCAANVTSLLCCDLREWLVYFDPWFAIWLVRPVFAIGVPCLLLMCSPARPQSEPVDGLLSWPFLAVLVMQGIGVGLWWLMIGVAEFCRDPNWNFNWPWEEQILRIVPLNNLNLSDWFWWREGQLPQFPEDPLEREIAGIGLVLAVCVGIAVSAYLLLRRANAKRSVWRVTVFTLVLQVQAIVVMKLFLRWFYSVKYFIALPEYSWNL